MAKVPRLPDATDSLSREAMNLMAVQAARANGFDSIPRVVTFEESNGYPMLLETALAGRPMSAALVRRRPEMCIEGIMDWLVELHSATAVRNGDRPEWFDQIAEGPLVRLRSALPVTPMEENLIDQTGEILDRLRGADLPLVFEHGDLSSPNILILKNGKAGVVDWELASANSLPVLDLFFYLTFVAFARRDARRRSEYLAAFHEAFFGHRAWARPYILRYVERLGLPSNTIEPLFILCWSRYVHGLLARLNGGSATLLNRETVEWLRTNRFYLLWQHAVAHRKELNWMN